VEQAGHSETDGSAGLDHVAPLLHRAWREAHLVWTAVRQAVVRFYQSDDLTFASSIAYYALLSLFPFCLLVLSFLGRIAVDEPERRAVLDFVLRYFPATFEFVTVQLEALRYAHIPLGLASTMLLVWASLGFFGALTSAVDHAWRVEYQRSYLLHKLVSFLMLVAASLLLLTAVVIVSAIGFLESTRFGEAISRVPYADGLSSVAVRWAGILLPVFVLGLVYYFVPNARVRFRDVWGGAILAGLLWRGALVSFAWYIRDMSRFSVVHGSIAAVVAFLLWVYISAVILLFGVEFTAAYARLRRAPGG
jgi:membrane protein